MMWWIKCLARWPRRCPVCLERACAVYGALGLERPATLSIFLMHRGFHS